ncbi:Glucokinase [hydrothermal vent metagenome]|uniref:Glucokinase n=1 Tax=hydrothermal vent metagenome TaxID=652676 RepID=A0A3B1CRG1_9ZZZZ
MKDKKYAIGADIGGTNLRVALVDREGEIVERVKTSSTDTDNVFDSLVSAIDRFCSDDVAGIGIGVAGVIEREKGIVKRSPNLPSVEGVGFIDGIRQRFSLPVYIENDANAAALGERWAGAGRKFKSFVLFTLGTGIGGGVIYDGHLLDIAAELGHISIEAEGVRCPCGNNGCLESYASARAMTGRAVESIESGTESLMKGCCEGNVYKISPEDIYSYALEGDNLARETLKTAGRYLGVGIASAINIFSPEAVILTGGLIGAWNIYVETAIKEASKRAFPELYGSTKILPSLLKDDAGVIGAACLVFDKTKS